MLPQLSQCTQGMLLIHRSMTSDPTWFDRRARAEKAYASKVIYICPVEVDLQGRLSADTALSNKNSFTFSLAL